MTQDESERLTDALLDFPYKVFEDFVRDQICHLSKGIQDNFLYTQQLEKRIAELEKEAKVVRFF